MLKCLTQTVNIFPAQSSNLIPMSNLPYIRVYLFGVHSNLLYSSFRKSNVLKKKERWSVGKNEKFKCPLLNVAKNPRDTSKGSGSG